MNSGLNKAHGAVLVITLVILLIITLISVTQLSGANNQHRMVNNAQQFSQTFNAAESALSQALYGIEIANAAGDKNMSAMADAINSNSVQSVPATLSKNTHINVLLNYQAKDSNVLRAGISLDASNDDIMIRNVNFEVQSIASINSSGASSSLSRGFIYE